MAGEIPHPEHICLHCGHGLQRMGGGKLECVGCHYTVAEDFTVDGGLRDVIESGEERPMKPWDAWDGSTGWDDHGFR